MTSGYSIKSFECAPDGPVLFHCEDEILTAGGMKPADGAQERAEGPLVDLYSRNQNKRQNPAYNGQGNDTDQPASGEYRVFAD